MKRNPKPFVISTAILSVLVIMALAGNAVRTANAAFTLPLFSSKPAVSANVPELGVVEVKGLVDAVAADSYTVSGLSFRFDALTIISGAPVVGDSVEVKALLLPDLTRYALKIEKTALPVTTPGFEFYGLVEAMAADMWTISGEQVQITPDSKVDAEIAAGDLVEVKGTIAAGQMVASDVSLKESNGSAGLKVELIGTIESITGTVYVINGKTVNTDASTVITGTLAVGSMVKVQATLNGDGTYLASGISLVTPGSTPGASDEDHDQDDDSQGEDTNEDDNGKEVKITGTVESFSATSLVVNGVTITIDPKTKIDGTLAVGAMVKVEARQMTDGTTVAHEIEIEEDSNPTQGDEKSGSDDEHNDSNSSSSSEHADDHSGSNHGNHDGDHEDDHGEDGGSGSDSFGFSS